jgi:hypothetical protein
MNDLLERTNFRPDRTASADTSSDHAGKSGLARIGAAFDEVLGESSLTKDLLGWATFVATAVVFVAWGAASLEVGHQEARTAMAAREPMGAVGQSFGGLDPAVYPGSIALIKLWGLFESDGPGSDSVRWPAAILAIAVGVALALRAEFLAGKRLALWVGLCWFSSLAVVHRSGEVGIDFAAGFGLLLALDRCIAQGGRVDWLTGAFTALSFMCAGLPPVILVTAASIVLCRSSAGLGSAYLGIVLATIGGWSAWALSTISAEAWAAAIALPVALGGGSSFPTTALLLCLPVVLAVPASFGKSIREGWCQRRTDYVNGWWTIAALSLFVGTILPQFASTALLPVVAGCVVVASQTWASAVAKRNIRDSGFSGRWLAASTGIFVAALAVVGIPLLVYVSLTIPYYRQVSLVCAVLAGIAAIVYVKGVVHGELRRVAVSLVVACVAVKAVHATIYVPEWNYRRGQGAWGRAVGQWVPDGWPIYTLNGWPTDFAFATGHNFRQITHPRFLPDPAKAPDGRPSFILLHPADFEHWPKTAPPLIKVFEFHDQSGNRVAKVLARTGPEKPAWQKLIYRNPIRP